MTKYEEGTVVINQEVCIGCEYCIHACPWEVITKNDITSKASKCTMCSDRVSEDKQPFCVQACPVGALDFGLTEEITDKATQRTAAVSGYLYGDREAGGGNVAAAGFPVAVKIATNGRCSLGCFICDFFRQTEVQSAHGAGLNAERLLVFADAVTTHGALTGFARNVVFGDNF